MMVAVPAVLTAGVVSATEGHRLLRPGAPLFAAPSRDTLADAIAVDDILGGYAFIRAGQNPDGLIPVRDEMWTGGSWMLVSPMIWAVANNADDSVLMLLTAGAQLSNQQDRRAACMAEALGRARVAQRLRAYAPHQLPAPCPPFPSGGAPLARFVGDSE
jgi:hypothetical protein